MKLDIAKRIREVREQRGISQKDLAEKIGLHRSEICHIEKRRRVPTIQNIVKISEGLAVSLSYLLDCYESDLDKRFNKLSSKEADIVSNFIDSLLVGKK